MDTRIDEIASGIYRLSTFVPEVAPPAGMTFNQFLILGEEPLLFHTGHRHAFPLVRAAVSRLIAPERLRFIAFGHYEADECGAMNEWLAAAPNAQAAHGQTGCMVFSLGALRWGNTRKSSPGGFPWLSPVFSGSFRAPPKRAAVMCPDNSTREEERGSMTTCRHIQKSTSPQWFPAFSAGW